MRGLVPSFFFGGKMEIYKGGIFLEVTEKDFNEKYKDMGYEKFEKPLKIEVKSEPVKEIKSVVSKKETTKKRKK